MAKISLLTDDQAHELAKELRRKQRNLLVQDQIKGDTVRGGFHGKKGYQRRERSGKNWLHSDD